MFVHTVYFWLREGTPEAARQQLIDDCRTLLAQVPTVQKVWAGPAANTPRDVVDNSYGCGLTVLFASREDHDVYQDHPLHQDFIERNREHWERVQVYDYLDGSA
ncbi:MAG: Dabb family protein [Armatimonadota bacterium]